ALTPEKVPATPDGTVPLFSPHSWSVPGCVDGWVELHRRYGRLPFADLLEPAVRYAEEGFPVSTFIAEAWAVAVAMHARRPGFADVYMPGARTPREGDPFRNEALARSLRLIAAHGREAFYEGPIADALVRYSAANGGFFSHQDFTSPRTTWDEP